VGSSSTWFRRLLLPGFAFKAAVIGGGYATGRELVTFFLPSGPWGGLFGMFLAMAVWSSVCVVTFLFALQTGSRDYRSFFRNLLGPLWPAFEIAFFFSTMLVLAVFAAAAGAIAQAITPWPSLAGSILLVAAITYFATFGNEMVERLFKYVSLFLYATYALFLVLSLTMFGPDIATAFARNAVGDGWIQGGLTYAGYNIVGAVVILPVIRHMRSRNDAIVAGVLAGLLAMLPAVLFFVSMTAFYPQIGSQLLPSDFLLQRMHLPAFRIIFQLMIFAALLESGTGMVHAINERVAHTYRAGADGTLSPVARLCITATMLAGSVFVAERIGLIALIANGYRLLSMVFLLTFVLPVMTYGLWSVWRHRPMVARDLINLADKS
jgi:uncharacterized membrane protein YkvI